MPDISKVALIIGVDCYYEKDPEGNPLLPLLLSCKKDAIDLYNLLSSDKLGYRIFGNSPIIGSNLDKNYGYTEVNKSINDFFLDAEPGQTVLFYFSGHGIPWAGDVYLATPQTNPKRPSIAGFSLTSLTKLMESSRSARIVCIIDACYSGAAKLPDSKGIIDKDAAESDAIAANDTYSEILNIPKAEGKSLLLSSQAYEKSRASENDNSIYTKYIVEGLRGARESIDEKGVRIPASIDNNGNVTPETLHDYVYLKVANEVRQTPKIKSDKSSRIVIATHPELSKRDDSSLRYQYVSLLLSENVKEFNQFRKKNPGNPIDLTGINLASRWLNLQGVDLSGVTLRETNLSCVILTNANFESAYIEGVHFRGSLRRGRRLGPSRTRKRGTREAMPSKRDYIDGLSAAFLGKNNFRNCIIKNVDFTELSLNDSTFENARLHDVRLGGAWLENTTLTGAEFKNSSLFNCHLGNADLKDTTFQHCDLRGADLNGAKNLKSAMFLDSKELPYYIG